GNRFWYSDAPNTGLINWPKNWQRRASRPLPFTVIRARVHVPKPWKGLKKEVSVCWSQPILRHVVWIYRYCHMLLILKSRTFLRIMSTASVERVGLELLVKPFHW